MLSVTSAFVATALAIAYPAMAQDSAASTPTPSSGSSAGGVAGLVSGLSSSCQAAAGSLLSSDFGSCANIIGLVSVIGAQGSVVPALNTWVTGICSGNPCSDATISAAQSNVNAGCSDDINKGTVTAASLSTIINNYKSIRSLLCTQYTSNSTFCVTSVLTNVQAASSKNISVTDVEMLLTQGPSAVPALASVPSGAYCTDCGHALFTQAAAIKPSGTSTNATAASGNLAAKCGASFTDGQLPSTVKVAGTGSSAAKNSGAAQDTPRFAIALSVLALASALVV